MNYFSEQNFRDIQFIVAYGIRRKTNDAFGDTSYVHYT